MKILFIDHAFHKKTKSSNFFFNIIAKNHKVDVFYFDENYLEIAIADLHRKVSSADYDLVVVWQLEVLSLIPLALNTPTVIVPMYDGCANQPQKHWNMFSEASIINFSYNLDVRISKTFVSSLLVKYFPDPKMYKVCDSYDEANVFAWLRRPKDICSEAVFRLTRQASGNIHFHTATDSPDEVAEVPDWMLSYNVTTSSWFDSKADFDALVNRYNVTVCPRLAEGIGMFMLESMARGMCVIAAGIPVHNEYICNNINGYLFDHGNYAAIDLTRFKEVGQSARYTIERGFLSWQQDIDKISDFIDNSAAFMPDRGLSIDTAKHLVKMYFNDMSAYLAALPDEYEAVSANNKVESIVRILREKLPTGEHSIPVGNLEIVRKVINSVPGWSFAKKFVPNRLKQRVAARISDN